MDASKCCDDSLGYFSRHEIDGIFFLIFPRNRTLIFHANGFQRRQCA